MLDEKNLKNNFNKEKKFKFRNIYILLSYRFYTIWYKNGCIFFKLNDK